MADKKDDSPDDEKPPESDAPASTDSGDSTESSEDNTSASEESASADDSKPEKVSKPLARRAWGEPLVRIDIHWTNFETWLAVIVITGEVIALTLWIGLRGMSTPAESASYAGIVFRALFGATVLGTAALFALRNKSIVAQRVGSLTGVFLGVALAKMWSGFGVDYTSNLLNWFQQASSLTLFGGLRGVGTRLTLLLAMLGGSLATARGKHITIDLVTRYVNDTLRLPIVLAGWLGASVICFAGSWGFFDYISIENFGANPDASPTEIVVKVGEELEEQFFIARKQANLDFKSIVQVGIKGKKYSDWLGAEEWNQYLDDGGFKERYGAEAIDPLRLMPGETRAPIVVVPGRGEPRGELINAANLVFPIGLFIIALRFLLRSLLALSGHVSVDPEDSGDFTTDLSKVIKKKGEAKLKADAEAEAAEAAAAEGEAATKSDEDSEGGAS